MKPNEPGRTKSGQLTALKPDSESAERCKACKRAPNVATQRRWPSRPARVARSWQHPKRQKKFLEERAYFLEQELMRVEEHERRRLSMDLHDGLSQTIALIKLKLGAMRRFREPTLEKAVLEIEELIDEANHSVRSITFELCPRALDDLGLGAALEELVLNIGARYGTEVVLEDDGRLKVMTADTRVILFRSVRELLINACKHARAGHVCIRLSRDGNMIQATVEDDGVGMRLDRTTRSNCGLFDIRERLGHVRGSMHIESTPGCGTKISLSAPAASGRTSRAKASA
jgi:signal transduction histidine kinase